MRGQALALVLAACSYQHGVVVDDTSDGGPGDGKLIDSAIDGMKAPACLTSNNDLVWCLEFDEPGLDTAATTIDGSGHNYHPAIANIELTMRTMPESSQAIRTSSISSITMAKPSDFNLQDFTMTAWIYRTSTAELGIIDTADQYTLSIDSSNQTVECAIRSTTGSTVGYTGGSQTTANEWALVACTYDGSQVCTYSFRNGSTTSQRACAWRSSTTATSGTTTTAAVWANSQSHFIGSLDQIRLYKRALSTLEICQAGGLTGC